MIDLALCHWIVDEQNRLYLASAPSLRAPFRFDCHMSWYQQTRRLTDQEAALICQASIECGMRPMTFLNSWSGIQFVQDLMQENTATQTRVA